MYTRKHKFMETVYQITTEVSNWGSYDREIAIAGRLNDISVPSIWQWIMWYQIDLGFSLRSAPS